MPSGRARGTRGKLAGDDRRRRKGDERVGVAVRILDGGIANQGPDGADILGRPGLGEAGERAFGLGPGNRAGCGAGI